MKFNIPVKFNGTVDVEIPDLLANKLSLEQWQSLAEKVALSRIIATIENPDAPEDDACCEYGEEWDLEETIAEKQWDSVQTTGVTGTWE